MTRETALSFALARCRIPSWHYFLFASCTRRRRYATPHLIMISKKHPLNRAVVPQTEPVGVRGRDGRLVQIPPGYAASQGRDGRMVAVPSGAGSLEGEDGRIVVIPPGHIGIETAKGRVVAKLR
jgi:hypothetical protein